MPLAHVQQRVRLGVQIQGRLRGQIEVDEGDAHDTTKVRTGQWCSASIHTSWLFDHIFFTFFHAIHL